MALHSRGRLVCILREHGSINSRAFHISFPREYPVYFFTSFTGLLVTLSKIKLVTNPVTDKIPVINRNCPNIPLPLLSSTLPKPPSLSLFPLLCLRFSLSICSCVLKCPSLSKCGTSFPCPHPICPGPIPPPAKSDLSAPFPCAAARLAECSPHPPLR